jgi:hypothetical protein
MLQSMCFLAQYVPGGISYQAIARESGGAELINQNLTVRIGILRGNATGLLMYEEVHDVVTNGFGLFALVIGNGVSTGSAAFDQLPDVPFGAEAHFMRVEVDTPQSAGFELLGVSELQAVPYAYHAAHAAHADSAVEADGDPANELITSFALSGNSLTIEEGGTTHTVSLSGITGSGSEMVITDLSLVGLNLQIEQNGVIHSVDLQSVANGVWQVSQPGAVHTSQRVGIGVEEPQSSLQVNGSYAGAIQVVEPADGNTATVYPLAEGDQIVIANTQNGEAHFALPPSAGCPGRIYQIRRFFPENQTGYPVVIEAQEGDTLDGQPMRMFASVQPETIAVVAAPTGWYVLNHSISQ